MVLRSLVLSLVVLSLSACNFTGSGQKGPLIAGSTVILSKLDNQANPSTTKTTTTKTWGSQGRFSNNKVKWNGWTEAKISGKYFNEFTNTISDTSISLEAITRKDRTFDIVNIQLYSHIAAARIRQQVANGESTYNAWKSTQLEMKQAFGLIKVSSNIHRGVEQLSLTQGSGRFRKDNANLLLFTGAFLANNGDAAALEVLSDDFADDGQFNGVGADVFNSIAQQGSVDGLLTTLSQNLKYHGAYNPPNSGDMPELPSWVNDDDTGAPDNDGDGIPDETDPDDDNDGVLDEDDAFPLDENESIDTDGDGTGNNADTDDDNDGYSDELEITEGSDPLDPDSKPNDNDNDGIPDTTDPDDDNDGTLDVHDAFPHDPNESVDTDGDGTGNNADTDDDNDNVLDADDAFPLDSSESVDTDGDGTGNNADTDDDNDNVLDADDAFPLDSSESVDTDGDGTGNNADTDDDNDGYSDDEEITAGSDPLDPSSTPAPVIDSTNISGIIKSIHGNPISGANIQAFKNGIVQSLSTTLSDSSGNYLINLEINANYTIVVQQFGYANQVIPINSLTGTSLVLDIVMLANDLDQDIDPTTGNAVSDNAGSEVQWDDGGFDGVAPLQLTITSLDTSDVNERGLIPGDLVDPFKLFFVGLTEFTFMNASDEEVTLASGETAEITIPIYQNKKIDGSPYIIGDTVQLFYLNEDTGKWEQDGIATVVASNAPSGLSAKGTVSHFSWWALSYPSNPAIVGSFATSTFLNDVIVSADGNTAFISDGSAGTKILDISDYSNIQIIGSYTHDSYGLELSSDESKLYVSRGSKLEILEISNPASITSSGILDVNPSYQFAISSDGTKLYSAFFNDDTDLGFHIVDISNPLSPSILDSVQLAASNVRGLTISNDEKTAFIVNPVEGLVIIDITDPNNITKLSSITAGYALGVTISDDSSRAYVSDNSGKKLHIIDTSILSNPQRLGVVSLTDAPRAAVVTSTETHAYVASWESGLQVVDINDKNNPLLIGNVNTNGHSIRLAITLDDQHVFIADWDGGLQIVDTSQALLGNSIPPTITILGGGSYINHIQGTPYVDSGAIAVDDLDGTVTVTTTGTVDVDALGSHNYITYRATDSSGNTSVRQRTVYIIQAPETGNTVIDAVSGLEVQDNESVRTSMGRTWFEAIEYCEDLVLNDLDDWRLPNETDYNDIDNRNYAHVFGGDPLLNHYGFAGEGGIFPLTGAPNRATYWTSFEDSTDTTKAYRIYNEDGVIGLSRSKTLLMGSRCVRN